MSTLDGKLSALDLADKGKIKWTIEVGDGPMLSSNIHRREVQITSFFFPQCNFMWFYVKFLAQQRWPLGETDTLAERRVV